MYALLARCTRKSRACSAVVSARFGTLYTTRHCSAVWCNEAGTAVLGAQHRRTAVAATPHYRAVPLRCAHNAEAATQLRSYAGCHKKKIF
eukprot:scaffold17375_cov102-Isochrysis_galbana.AAC.10